MPHDVIQAKGHDRKVSLGWIGTWWIENFVVHGRGGARGTPIRYGDEYTLFVVDCYALNSFGKRLYDSAFLSRPKGTDKSGIAAALTLFEAFGPCRFAGIAKGGETYEFLGLTYVYEAGEVMGKPVKSPTIKIMATEEGQTGNVYDNIYFNLTDDDAPLSVLRAAYGVEAWKTGIEIPHNGGTITPTTAGAASKDGGLETFAVFDETHLYTTGVLREMYNTVVRNLSKRRDTDGTWFIETTTMYEPGANSVAEDTYVLAANIREGKARRQKLLFDHRYAQIDADTIDKIKVPDEKRPGKTRFETNDEQEERLKAAFIEAFGDAIAWNSPDTLLDDLFDPRRSVSDTIRYFFNCLVEGNHAWIRLIEWVRISVGAMAKAAKASGQPFRVALPRKGDMIALGFDGGKSNDATALIAIRISDGYIFPIKVWEAPDSKNSEGWTISHPEVDGVIDQTFKKFKVVAFFADPPQWRDYVDKWERVYGPDLKVSHTSTHPIAWETNNHAAMAKVVERAEVAIRNGEVMHGGNLTLTRHVQHATKWYLKQGHVIGKDRRGSAKKMDAAVAMCLAIEARAQYRAVAPKTTTTLPRRIR